ncbi:c-type cytochrome [Rhodopirellula europaea]|uniref:Class I triheme cytochrome c n=1 Tax=Rhodopirellula europaea 6C TaxID=1263867 RepID=M2AAY8_9BACT|nr:c-type cytochrome [Rhodopirellula europaea]EMB13765.1 class I triheme cytochrome c [Rhodopirellula europaea 6C]
MLLTWKRALIACCVFGMLGTVVLVSGVVPVKASSGHWQITRWFLNFASDRSVSFHSRGTQPPEDSGLMDARLGAEIYKTNCRFCHGLPGQEQPPVAKGMTPTPPRLDRSLLEKEPRELHYIIQHGIKFAGMPAWPVPTRSDEIWPVVAYLRQALEENREAFDAERSENDLAALAKLPVLQACVDCHGVDGVSRAGKQVPHLTGQAEGYLRLSLLAFRSSERNSGVMMPVCHALTDQEIDALSKHYHETVSTNLPASLEAEVADHATIERGRELAMNGDRGRKIPSCQKCHGPDAENRRDEYPNLAGQSKWYLQRQLELFQKRVRGGAQTARLMHPIADKLSEQERSDLATFYASLQTPDERPEK